MAPGWGRLSRTINMEHENLLLVRGRLTCGQVRGRLTCIRLWQIGLEHV